MIVLRSFRLFAFFILFVIVFSTNVPSICYADVNDNINADITTNSHTKGNAESGITSSNSSPAAPSVSHSPRINSPTNEITINDKQKAKLLFAQGTKAYQQGDYSLAVDFFQSAHDFGLDIPRLYFNLGSSYFKLSQYSSAFDAFIKAATDPQLAVLSRINLGLCAIKMQKPREAEFYLRSALALAKTEKYRLQILTVMEKQGFNVSDNNSTQGWHNQMALMLGRNRNVTLYEIDQVGSKQDDDYLHAIFNGSYQTDITPSGRIMLDVSIQSLNYQTLNEYDYTSINMQPSYQQQIGSWNIYLAGSNQNHYLDGAFFLNSRSLQNRLKYRINTGWSVSANFIDTLHTDQHDSYDYLAGTQLQQTYQLEYSSSHISFQLHYQLEQNNRHDLLTRSYSPKRVLTGLQLAYTVTARQTLSLAADHRNAYYPQDTESLANSREDKRDSYTLRYSVKVHTATHAFVSYNAINNSSNRADYDYHSKNVLMGLSWRR